MTEPNVESDGISIQTVAMRQKEYYAVDGTKSYITNGSATNMIVLNAKA
ncbi:MAG: hypothetical protein JXC33_11265 [Deltaproteobacteria bacterium]|nr:hypothetical protein [Deltaproteobacteria bacterium]